MDSPMPKERRLCLLASLGLQKKRLPRLCCRCLINVWLIRTVRDFWTRYNLVPYETDPVDGQCIALDSITIFEQWLLMSLASEIVQGILGPQDQEIPGTYGKRCKRIKFRQDKNVIGLLRTISDRKAGVQKVPITGKYISAKNPLWITNDFFCSESESTASSWWSSSTVTLLQWASTLQSMKFSYLPNCSTNQSTACVAQCLSLEMPEHNKWRWQLLVCHVRQWHAVAGCFQLIHVKAYLHCID